VSNWRTIGIVVDSSDNLYYTGFTSASAGYVYLLVKVSSTGSVITSQYASSGSANQVLNCSAVGLDGLIYAGGGMQDSSYNTSGGITKWSANLGLYWSMKGNNNVVANFQGVGADASGNVYGSVVENGRAQIYKLDSGGNYVTAKSYGVSNYYFQNYGALLTDGSYVYALYLAYNQSNNARYLYLFKYDTSFNLQYVRKINTTAVNTGNRNPHLEFDGAGDLLITSHEKTASGGDVQQVIRYPADGSITGNWNVGGTTIYIQNQASVSNYTPKWNGFVSGGLGGFSPGSTVTTNSQTQSSFSATVSSTTI
jgi:hypothetical protein